MSLLMLRLLSESAVEISNKLQFVDRPDCVKQDLTRRCQYIP